ncbi:MAG: chorismate pyruvate-lyase family protein [Cyanobacteriota bacterium]|nr:chorismate pyruvate-lyase family protein [Cyanobacteriota bacterium]
MALTTPPLPDFSADCRYGIPDKTGTASFWNPASSAASELPWSGYLQPSSRATAADHSGESHSLRLSEAGEQDILLDILWQGDPHDYPQGISHPSLPPIGQLLLLGDGLTTRHLQLITGQTISAEVLSSQEVAGEGLPRQCFPELVELGHPLMCRRVCLHPTPRQPPGQPLLYAASWWDPLRIQEFLPDPSLPIGQSLWSARREIFRDLRQIYWGQSLTLQTLFAHPGPFWARYYLLWHQQQPLTLIYEVFSPVLFLS